MRLLQKWWEGRHLTCRGCGQQFALEASDKPQDGFLNSVPYYAFVRCPSCKEPVNVDVPWNAVVPR